MELLVGAGEEGVEYPQLLGRQVNVQVGGLVVGLGEGGIDAGGTRGTVGA